MVQLTTQQSDIIHSDETNARRQDGENAWPGPLVKHSNVPLADKQTIHPPTIFPKYVDLLHYLPEENNPLRAVCMQTSVTPIFFPHYFKNMLGKLSPHRFLHIRIAVQSPNSNEPSWVRAMLQYFHYIHVILTSSGQCWQPKTIVNEAIW